MLQADLLEGHQVVREPRLALEHRGVGSLENNFIILCPFAKLEQRADMHEIRKREEKWSLFFPPMRFQSAHAPITLVSMQHIAPPPQRALKKPGGGR